MGKQKILALDFDGCIVDSVMEALFVTYVSYRRYINKETRIFDNKEPEINKFLSLISNYEPQVRKFREYRHYIKDASDYAVILYIIEDNLKVGSEGEFFKTKKLIPDKDIERFYQCFYDTRAKLFKDNFDAWARLTPGFSCINEMRRLANEHKTIMATTNNKETARPLLTEQYLNLNIEEEDIVDLHISTDKTIQMEYIVNKYGVKFEGIHFLDDNLSQLLAVRPLGVNVYLASWGYCTEEQKNFAKKSSDINFLTEENMYSVLSEALY